METYTTLEIIRLFKEKEISLFTASDFSRLLGIDNQNTIYKKLERLENKKVIKSLIKGKYVFLFLPPDDYTLANFLCPPSYISLETALSFYGIITGFPYQRISITPRKSRQFNIDNKEYVYSQIKPSLFFGYGKKDNFLIAEPEKALFDFIYFGYKGLRNTDLSEFNLSEINVNKLKTYLHKITNNNWQKYVRGIKI